MTTRFTFAGEWGPWITVILGLLLAGLAFLLLRRRFRKEAKP